MIETIYYPNKVLYNNFYAYRKIEIKINRRRLTDMVP